jgi:hypothetical protein
MSQSFRTISASGLILVALASRLFAQPYTFDENGNGFTSFAYPPFPLLGEVVPDPSGGITNSPVLMYPLGGPVVPGDVTFVTPGGATVAVLLRFFTYPTDTNKRYLILYSQPYSANPVAISETSPQTLWYPGADQPGASALPAFPIFETFEYFIITTSAPPVSLSGTNLLWNLTTGPASRQFSVLATTNISLPFSNWARVSTNQFDALGRCRFTLPIEPDKPRLFYGLCIYLN